ncbi:uncharacterized protein BT62DRAFT_1073832 [Guyanagaster necrorhizus]|uniref:Ubiquitin-like domain-containing protein n=1 Tax=Guyanagaster necrorhizus TaxID=856835 RepID=A0A9P7VY56_9AGAR|nr:uncharacterized protein BT62DRAFT_1073832 [Guyanagaster necrorhizus MCA 3950]KAG7449353.1 hypothetical protein BT62DRAFT_1073832 [Guyanagaster necrorhizus MCA 3950]
MSLVELHVELPAYAHSFTVNVDSGSTILAVKEQIQAVCTGRPRVDGQRLIWRGRALADHERLDAIWTSPDESRIVHLAVHPTAWSDSPPLVPRTESSISPASLASSSVGQLLRSVSEAQSWTLPSRSSSLGYVIFQHRNALLALMQCDVVRMSHPTTPRREAVRYLASQGWSWPPIFDADYPPRTSGGVRYKPVIREGKNYLSLEDSSQVPTATQQHALKVLSYTLSILKSDAIPVPTRTVSQTTQHDTIPPQVTALLQQLRLLNGTIQNPQNVVLNDVPVGNQMPAPPELPQLQIRPFLLPLTFLLLRTLLLLYFFAPARKPFIGILIMGWALYEIWTRHGFNRWIAPVAEDQRPAAGDAAPADNQVNRPPAAVVAPGAAAAEVGRVDGAQVPSMGVLDTLANLNIPNEERMLEGTVTEPPTFGQKCMTFMMLLVTTVHPAVWDRRRAVLRRREGRIRTEANAMEVRGDGEDTEENRRREQRREELAAQHARRPGWVRQYVRRVVANDWVDDD